MFISVLVSLEDTSLRKKGKGLMFQQTLCFGSLPWRRMNLPGLSRCYQLLKLHSNYRRILCDPILKVFRVLISHYFHHPRPISDKRESTLEFLCVIQSDLACLQGEIKIIKCIPWTILWNDDSIIQTWIKLGSFFKITKLKNIWSNLLDILSFKRVKS